MPKRTVQSFFCWFCLFSCLLFTACGSAGDAPLSVGLQLPVDTNADLFWYDVEKRELKVDGKNGAQVIPWSSGAKVELSARAGDELTFSGYDRSGELRVEGRARVTEEKRILVPLRRIL